MKKKENKGSCSQIPRNSQTVQDHRDHSYELRLHLVEMGHQ